MVLSFSRLFQETNPSEYPRQCGEPRRVLEGDAHGVRSEERAGPVEDRGTEGGAGRFYVTVTYGEAGQTRIDYKTYDVHKASEFPFTTNRGDAQRDQNRPSPG